MFFPSIHLNTCSVMVGRGRRPWEGDWDSVRETLEPPVSPPTVLVTVLPSGSRSTHLQQGAEIFLHYIKIYFPPVLVLGGCVLLLEGDLDGERPHEGPEHGALQTQRREDDVGALPAWTVVIVTR